MNWRSVAVVRRALVPCILISLLSTITGCSWFGERYDSEHGHGSSAPPLDIPPDLTESEWGRSMPVPGEPASAVAESRKGGEAGSTKGSQSGGPEVLPEFRGVEVRREGNTRWVRINAIPSKVWPRLRGFWREQGVPLRKDDPALGVMVTDWYQHHGALPQTGIRGLLGRETRYLTDTGIRDRYRLRVERSGANSDVYITTQRAAKTTPNSAVENSGNSSVAWALAPPDPELDAEMLAKLMVYLGATEEKARVRVSEVPEVAEVKMRITGPNSHLTLIVEDGFRNVWRVSGVALDRAGLYVEQQDREKGIFYFTYTEEGQPKKSLFEKLFGGSGGLEVNKLYELHLRDDDPHTLITVHNTGEDADEPLEPEDARRLLKRFMSYYQLGG